MATEKPTAAEALLKVIQDIHDGGKDLIPHWTLLDHAKASLRRGGPWGLKRYYKRCIKSRRSTAAWVTQQLESHDRKTLESEYPRFLAIYRSYYPLRDTVIQIGLLAFAIVALMWLLSR